MGKCLWKWPTVLLPISTEGSWLALWCCGRLPGAAQALHVTQQRCGSCKAWVYRVWKTQFLLVGVVLGVLYCFYGNSASPDVLIALQCPLLMVRRDRLCKILQKSWHCLGLSRFPWRITRNSLSCGLAAPCAIPSIWLTPALGDTELCNTNMNMCTGSVTTGSWDPLHVRTVILTAL